LQNKLYIYYFHCHLLLVQENCYKHNNSKNQIIIIIIIIIIVQVLYINLGCVRK